MTIHIQDASSADLALVPRSPDRLWSAFDDDRHVAHEGLLLPATLDFRLGLRELANAHLDLGEAAGRANAGHKLLTLIGSAIAVLDHGRSPSSQGVRPLGGGS